MPKRDISGEVVEKVAEMSRVALDRLREFMPIGPYNVQLTPAELRKSLERMTADQYQQMIQRLGAEEATRVLMAVQPKLPGPKDLAEYMEEEDGTARFGA